MAKWKSILQVAATYIGTVVGAGFASGQEIMQFFTVYGSIGSLLVIVSTLLFIWLGCKMMNLANLLLCYSYQELNYHLFGRTIGMLLNGSVLLILFASTGVMLSGSGAVFSEQLGMSTQLGIIITIALSLIVILRGISGILWINSLVVPMMITFTIILGVNHIGAEISQTPHPVHWNWRWITSPFLYTALNLAMAQAVLVPLGREFRDPSIIRWGGIVGGSGLGIMLLISHLSLHTHFDFVQEASVPMAKLVTLYGQNAAVVFSLIIFGEIFTTITGNVFGLARHVQNAYHISNLTAVVSILLGALLISQWGFRTLVAVLYPIFGGISLLFLARLALYKFNNTIK
jgi:uncharacterized membrane protein YkvI